MRKKLPDNPLPSLEIIEKLSDGYYEIDKQWRYTYVNKQGEVLAKKSKEEMIGKKATEIFPGAARLEFGKIAKEVMKDGKQRFVEAYYPAFNKWFRGTVYPLSNGIGIIVKDITSIKRAENESTEAEALINSSNDAIITKSLEGIITGWNKAAEKLYKYTAQEIIGKPISILIPPHKKDDFPKIMQQLISGKRVSHYETQRLTKNNKLIDVSISVSPIKDERGNLIGASKIARDITQRIMIEKELRRSEERLKLALGVGKIGVWDWELNTDTFTWTDEVYKIYEVEQKDFIPKRKRIYNFFHPEDREQIEKYILNLMEKETDFTLEYRIKTKRGKIKWLVTHALITRNESGKVNRIVGAITDITEQKKIDQEKDDFISIATHELKTPVTSLKIYAEVLQRKFNRSGDANSAEQLMKMNIQLDKLTNLITDLLDVTKSVGGKLRMEVQNFQFDELVIEIIEELQRTTERHKIILKKNTPVKATADRDRIGQVMTNIISNAIKYSPHASKIVINSTADDKNIIFSVQDFGVGIPKESKNHVFDRFYRVSGSKQKTFPGMGLGLYISSEIIKRHDGKIWVESKEGEGSTFYFKIPLKINAS